MSIEASRSMEKEAQAGGEVKGEVHVVVAAVGAPSLSEKLYAYLSDKDPLSSAYGGTITTTTNQTARYLAWLLFVVASRL